MSKIHQFARHHEIIIFIQHAFPNVKANHIVYFVWSVEYHIPQYVNTLILDIQIILGLSQTFRMILIWAVQLYLRKC